MFIVFFDGRKRSLRPESCEETKFDINRGRESKIRLQPHPHDVTGKKDPLAGLKKRCNPNGRMKP